jgi:hypothetical protein
MFKADFGYALSALKNGSKVARENWHDNEIYIVQSNGDVKDIIIDETNTKTYGVPVGTLFKFDPFFMMKTADNTFIPWQITSTDLLATDWDVIK